MAKRKVERNKHLKARRKQYKLKKQIKQVQEENKERLYAGVTIQDNNAIIEGYTYTNTLLKALQQQPIYGFPQPRTSKIELKITPFDELIDVAANVYIGHKIAILAHGTGINIRDSVFQTSLREDKLEKLLKVSLLYLKDMKSRKKVIIKLISDIEKEIAEGVTYITDKDQFNCYTNHSIDEHYWDKPHTFPEETKKEE